MDAPSLKQFQEQVSELLLRHRSILDVLSKFNQSNAAVHRAVTKAVTECGCIEVNASRQQYSEVLTLSEARNLLQTHISGHLCEQCMEIVSSELGRNLFYLSALCNLLQVDLDKVIADESKRCSTLGLFNLS